jgi:hypothetical protein
MTYLCEKIDSRGRKTRTVTCKLMKVKQLANEIGFNEALDVYHLTYLTGLSVRSYKKL